MLSEIKGFFSIIYFALIDTENKVYKDIFKELIDNNNDIPDNLDPNGSLT